MMVHMRNFNPTLAEYTAVIAIHNADWPEVGATTQAWQQDDATRDQQYLFQRVVGEVGGEIVFAGDYGEMPWSHVSGKYYINCTIQPGQDEQTLLQAFYDHVLSILWQRLPAPKWIFAEAREDRSTRIACLENLGFVQVLRSTVSALDLNTFDSEGFAKHEARATKLGLTVLPLATLQKLDREWQRKYWELRIAVERDIPSVDPITDQPFSEYLKLLEQPNFCADAVFLAIDQQQQANPTQWRYVGVSSLWLDPDEVKIAETDLTGVLQPYRRQGIATVLKLQTIRYALAQGVHHIKTDNVVSNPMYHLNLRLGFKPQLAWLEFQKIL